MPEQVDVCSHHLRSEDLYPMRFRSIQPEFKIETSYGLHLMQTYTRTNKTKKLWQHQFLFTKFKLQGHRYPIYSSLEGWNKMLFHFNATLLPWPPKCYFIKHRICHKIPIEQHNRSYIFQNKHLCTMALEHFKRKN